MPPHAKNPRTIQLTRSAASASSFAVRKDERPPMLPAMRSASKSLVSSGPGRSTPVGSHRGEQVRPPDAYQRASSVAGRLPRVRVAGTHMVSRRKLRGGKPLRRFQAGGGHEEDLANHGVFTGQPLRVPASQTAPMTTAWASRKKSDAVRSGGTRRPHSSAASILHSRSNECGRTAVITVSVCPPAHMKRAHANARQ